MTILKIKLTTASGEHIARSINIDNYRLTCAINNTICSTQTTKELREKINKANKLINNENAILIAATMIIEQNWIE